jgi:hypothetical protein
MITGTFPQMGHRQWMGPFDAPHVPVLQGGMHAVRDRRQPGNELTPVPDLLALRHRRLQTAGRGQTAAACTAEPMKCLVGVARCLGEVDDRLFDPRPRRKQGGMAGNRDAARPVNDQVRGATDVPCGRHHHMNGGADLPGEAIQFSCCLVTENGAASRSQQGCP